MDHNLSRRQPRSYSISGQEYHHLAEYQAQRHRPSAVDQNQSLNSCQSNYGQKVRDYGGSSQYGHSVTPNRSLSPSNLTRRPTDFYVPKRSASIKYSYEKQPFARNHFHASLECLNTIYQDNGQTNQKQLQQLSADLDARLYLQHLQHQQQQKSYKQRPNYQNNHYAATYAPNGESSAHHQTAEHDLAAAAMAAPQHYVPATSSGSSSIKQNNMDQSYQAHNQYLGQGLFSRSTAPVTHSPLHRRMVPGPMASILNQITSSASNPLRAGHSSLSLASSTYLIEDKLQNEIKQLQSELKSEKEKSEALSSQLNINSNLMAAFEQSLTTLNNRLRQMTALNERKDKEIDLLRSQLESSARLTVDVPYGTSEKSTSPMFERHLNNADFDSEAQAEEHTQSNIASSRSPVPRASEQTTTQDGPEEEQNLHKIIEDLKKQLIEKDRLLTDTRLEALSAAHQLEQLESRMNGEQGMLANEDDLDEGVMVVNHSPSDSDAVTDSAHLNEQQNANRSSRYDHQSTNQQHRQAHHQSQRDSNNLEDMILFTPTRGRSTPNESHTGGLSHHSNQSNDDTNEMIHLHRHRQQDSHSDHSSSDYHDDDKSPCDTSQQEYRAHNGMTEQALSLHDKEVMNKMLDKLLVSN